MQVHDQVNARVWSTSKVLEHLQRSRENYASFTEWLRKTTGFLIATYGSAFLPVIEWVEDQDNVITNEALDGQFGPLGAEPVDDVLKKKKVNKSMLHFWP